MRCSVSVLAAALLLLAQDPLDLLVDDPGGLVAVVAGVHEVLAEEHLALRAPGHRADALAHAPLADHLAGQLGADHEVVVGAGGDDAEHELLGDAPAHGDHERVLEVVLVVAVAVLGRQLLGDAEGHAHREDRHLVQRVGVGEHGGADGVAGLVVGGELLLPVGQRHRVAALAHEHPVAGLLEVVACGSRPRPSAHGEQGGLVDQVRQVGAAHAGRAPGHDVEVDVGGRCACPWCGP